MVLKAPCISSYYLNTEVTQPSKGEHELHKSNCSQLYKSRLSELGSRLSLTDMYKPIPNNFEYIGAYNNDDIAKLSAQIKHITWDIDGCEYCCLDIHKK